MISNKLCQIFGGLGSVVYKLMSLLSAYLWIMVLTEGHLGKEVVDDMIVCNSMEEEITLPPQKVSVYSSRGSARVRPSVVAVVGQNRVGVVKVGNHDEPMIDAEPRDAVVLDNLRKTPSIAR